VSARHKSEKEEGGRLQYASHPAPPLGVAPGGRHQEQAGGARHVGQTWRLGVCTGVCREGDAGGAGCRCQLTRVLLCRADTTGVSNNISALLWALGPQGYHLFVCTIDRVRASLPAQPANSPTRAKLTHPPPPRPQPLWLADTHPTILSPGHVNTHPTKNPLVCWRSPPPPSSYTAPLTHAGGAEGALHVVGGAQRHMVQHKPVPTVHLRSLRATRRQKGEGDGERQCVDGWVWVWVCVWVCAMKRQRLGDGPAQPVAPVHLLSLHHSGHTYRAQ
jgi:hypothetical protein